MSFLLAIFLGVVQGLTEFLPISSSGHLVLLQKILGIDAPPVCFTTLVHLGTLLAVLLFFRKGLIREIRKSRVIGEIIIGTIPIVLVGLVVQLFVKEIFSSLLVVGLGYFLTAILLLWSRNLTLSQKKLTDLSDLQTFIIGCFQTIALLPGVSRSGTTIVGGLSQKLDRESSFKFSFYLSIPAIIGANILQLKNLSGVNFLSQSFLGMASAFVVGYFALKLLQKVLTAGKLYYFSFYCFSIGVISLLVEGVDFW